jgi:predicted nucleotidyltransferase
MTTSQHPDDDAQDALLGEDVPFLVMGGIASGVYGRPRWTRDVDLFIRPEDAGRALERLSEVGFETWVEHQHWLAKAKKHDVVVDLISRSQGDILLDDEMYRRGPAAVFKGRTIRLVPPEDLIVMKAVAASEDTPRYWYDAIGIIGRADLDWEYLIKKARPVGARRVLALLLYAESSDVLVPPAVTKAFADMVLGSDPIERRDVADVVS